MAKSSGGKRKKGKTTRSSASNKKALGCSNESGTRSSWSSSGSPSFLQPQVEIDRALSSLLRVNYAPRAELTKRVWDYVKARGLCSGRNITCDSALRKVFGVTSFDGFADLQRLLNEHITCHNCNATPRPRKASPPPPPPPVTRSRTTRPPLADPATEPPLADQPFTGASFSGRITTATTTAAPSNPPDDPIIQTPLKYQRTSPSILGHSPAAARHQQYHNHQERTPHQGEAKQEQVPHEQPHHDEQPRHHHSEQQSHDYKEHQRLTEYSERHQPTQRLTPLPVSPKHNKQCVPNQQQSPEKQSHNQARHAQERSPPHQQQKQQQRYQQQQQQRYQQQQQHRHQQPCIANQLKKQKQRGNSEQQQQPKPQIRLTLTNLTRHAVDINIAWKGDVVPSYVTVLDTTEGRAPRFFQEFEVELEAPLNGVRTAYMRAEQLNPDKHYTFLLVNAPYDPLLRRVDRDVSPEYSTYYKEVIREMKRETGAEIFDYEKWKQEAALAPPVCVTQRQNVSLWDWKDVMSFAKTVNIPEFEAACAKYRIRGPELVELSDGDLKELGLEASFLRRRVLAARQQLL